MAIAFDNTGLSVTWTANATSKVVDITNASTGALCLAFVVWNNNVSAESFTGWSQLISPANVGSQRHAVFFRRKQAGDTTFTLSWTTNASGGCIRWVSYTGAELRIDPPSEAQASSAHSSGASYVSPTAVALSSDRWAFQFSWTSSVSTTITWTPDGALTERADVNNAKGASTSTTLEIADSNGTVTAGAHSYTATCSTTSTIGASSLFYLVPNGSFTVRTSSGSTLLGGSLQSSDGAKATQVNVAKLLISPGTGLDGTIPQFDSNSTIQQRTSDGTFTTWAHTLPAAAAVKGRIVVVMLAVAGSVTGSAGAPTFNGVSPTETMDPLLSNSGNAKLYAYIWRERSLPSAAGTYNIAGLSISTTTSVTAFAISMSATVVSDLTQDTNTTSNTSAVVAIGGTGKNDAVFGAGVVNAGGSNFTGPSANIITSVVAHTAGQAAAFFFGPERGSSDTFSYSSRPTGTIAFGAMAWRDAPGPATANSAKASRLNELKVFTAKVATSDNGKIRSASLVPVLRSTSS